MPILSRTKKNIVTTKSSETSSISSRVQHVPLFVLRPQRSEKAYMMQGHRQYVFIVDSFVTKPMIARAITTRYNVKVVKVNIVYREGKLKRFRNSHSRRAGVKKAIVMVAKNQKIDIE